MALKFYWRCESTTLDGTHDFSAGDSTASATGAVSLSATAAKYGTNGLLTTDATDYYEFDLASILSTDVLEGAMGTWVQWKTAVPSSFSLPLRLANSAAVTNNIWVGAAASQEFKITITNPTTGFGMDTLAVNSAINTWYFVLGRWKFPNQRKVEVYNTSGTLIEEREDLATDMTTWWPSGVNVLRVGNNSTYANPIWVDNVFVADSYNEPIQNNLSITSYTQYAAGGYAAWGRHARQAGVRWGRG